jgi:hypothetical protein
MLTEFLERYRHLKSADFSAYKFQFLIVQLSQDLDSVNIFESEDHLQSTTDMMVALTSFKWTKLGQIWAKSGLNSQF